MNVGTFGDDATVFPWGMRSPVFGNVNYDQTGTGDGAYLFDPLGNVRATMVWPCRWQCSDPLQGAVSISADPNGRRESVTLTNVSRRADRPRRPRAQERAPELPLRPRLGDPGRRLDADPGRRGAPRTTPALDKRWGRARTRSSATPGTWSA